MTDSQKHVIGLILSRYDIMDILGPQQVFSTLPNVESHLKTLDPIKTEEGLIISPDTTFENCPPLGNLCRRRFRTDHSRQFQRCLNSPEAG